MMDDKRYQIFVSSTYKDLIEARNKVVETILNLYHFPIGMEMFSAADEEQWEVIKDTIAASDYYIVIIGHRYGSETEEGISYTEKEYDYAKQQGIPILTFVRRRDVSTKPNERDDDPEKIEKLNNFIEKATNDKMCDFWENTDQLAQKISVALNKMFNRNPQTGWVRADKAITPEVSKEITELSKENRELRKKVNELESKLESEVPELEVLLNGNDSLNLKFDDSFELFKPKEISFEEVPEHLRDYICKEDIEEYNNNLPSEEEINEYNRKKEIHWRVKNAHEKLNLSVVNNGTRKANQIYIEISFPDSFIVMEEDEVDELSEPEKPEFPENPIKEARKEYKKTSASLGSNLINDLGLNQTNAFPVSPSTVRNLSNVNPTSKCGVEGNEIKIWIKDLLHTRVRCFEDKIIVVPLKKGEYKLEVSVICEEYREQDLFYIPIEVE